MGKVLHFPGLRDIDTTNEGDGSGLVRSQRRLGRALKELGPYLGRIQRGTKHADCVIELGRAMGLAQRDGHLAFHGYLDLLEMHGGQCVEVLEVCRLLDNGGLSASEAAFRIEVIHDAFDAALAKFGDVINGNGFSTELREAERKHLPR